LSLLKKKTILKHEVDEMKKYKIQEEFNDEDKDMKIVEIYGCNSTLHLAL